MSRGPRKPGLSTMSTKYHWRISTMARLLSSLYRGRSNVQNVMAKEEKLVRSKHVRAAMVKA